MKIIHLWRCSFVQSTYTSYTPIWNQKRGISFFCGSDGGISDTIATEISDKTKSLRIRWWPVTCGWTWAMCVRACVRASVPTETLTRKPKWSTVRPKSEWRLTCVTFYHKSIPLEIVCISQMHVDFMFLIFSSVCWFRLGPVNFDSFSAFHARSHRHISDSRWRVRAYRDWTATQFAYEFSVESGRTLVEKK